MGSEMCIRDSNEYHVSVGLPYKNKITCRNRRYARTMSSVSSQHVADDHTSLLVCTSPPSLPSLFFLLFDDKVHITSLSNAHGRRIPPQITQQNNSAKGRRPFLCPSFPADTPTQFLIVVTRVLPVLRKNGAAGTINYGCTICRHPGRVQQGKGKAQTRPADVSVP